MVVFPNAKINLGLNVIEKRKDRYHNLETCFYPIPLNDVLEIVEAKKMEFTSTGIDIPGDPKTNLCLKAYELLNKDFGLPPVHIHLHKIIPIGAGLGGGSSDASHTLKILNEKFNLFLEDELLEDYAAKIGSDCPFFIKNEPVYATGIGNEFEEINVSLKGKHVAIIYPPIHVSTAVAYSNVNPEKPKIRVKEILETMKIEDWKQHLCNDFEESVFKKFPEIREIKETLIRNGALYSSMSGSGSSVYAIFDSKPEMENIFNNSYKVWTFEW